MIRFFWSFKIKINGILYRFEILNIFCNYGRSDLTGQGCNRNVVIMFGVNGVELTGGSKFITCLSN